MSVQGVVLIFFVLRLRFPDITVIFGVPFYSEVIPNIVARQVFTAR